jgi:hypothetical protein
MQRKRARNKVIGDVFGLLTITKVVRIPEGSKYKSYECLCVCGRTTIVHASNLGRGTKSCGCDKPTPFKSGEKHIKWKGHKEISGRFWGILRSRCKRFGNRRKKLMKFTITKEYVWNLYVQQNGKCALSGMPLTFSPSTPDKYDKTASLDRIDSSKGYVKGNVQWVHKDINAMKQAFSDEYFIEMCKNVVDNNT